MNRKREYVVAAVAMQELWYTRNFRDPSNGISQRWL